VVVSSRLFGIGLTFRGNIEKVITLPITGYVPYFNRTIVPHLTLIYPFMPVFSLYRVNEQLEIVAQGTKPFRIVFDGIRYFENESNVVYAAVAHIRAVKRLHFDLAGSLEGLIKEQQTDGRYNLEKFVPHVTIINKVPDDSFAELKKRLPKYTLHYEENITDFTLFAETKGIWQPKRVFKLEG